MNEVVDTGSPILVNIPTPVVMKPPTIMRMLLHSPSFLIGGIIVGFWIICALFGSHITPYNPYSSDLMNSLSPPSAAHWFGTDELGRDIFSRVLVGARDILTVAPLATLLGTVLGTILGLVAGYFSGWVDDVLSRFIDAFMALPVIIIALLALVALGASNATIIVVIAVIFAPMIARTVRTAVRNERELDYVAAARLCGEGVFQILFVEILPNIQGPILVETTVRLGYAVFTVASLSFLGFGIQPPSADWGLAISENYSLLSGGYWWTVVFDALATTSLVIGVNLVADSIHTVFEK